MEKDTLSRRYNRKYKKILVLVLGIIIVSASLAALLFTINHKGGAPPKIAQAQKMVDFPLYYPSKLPPGFVLNEKVSSLEQVILYSYTYDKTETISVSIQPLTDEISPNDFNPTSDFTTYIGRAYMVDMELRTTAAVMGEKSWLLINASENVPTNSFREFIDSFRPVQN